MTDTPKGKIVYSTERGRTCQRCGRPEKECRCAIKAEQAVPARIVAHLRIEKKGRGGKTVTVVDNLPRNPEFLKQLAAELKRACGSGGTAGDASIEIQGDHRDALRRLLAAKGWTVKG
jgi:translation initiation factor 1